MKNKKIGILTWHYYRNFGSALQSFALFTTIKKLGYRTIIINYRDPKLSCLNSSYLSRFKEFLRPIIGKFFKSKNLEWNTNAIIFANKYFKQSIPFNNEHEGRMVCKDYDILVCGSDQIWAPNVFNPVYFASFANQGIRKVSYAASIGLNDIPEDLVPKYKQLLSDFDIVGIREREGKDLLKSKCNVDSTVVLDPTLMVDVGTYTKMQKPIKGIKKPFLFCYFLNKEHQYKENVEKYANEHHLQIVGISDKASDSEWMICLTGLGADHFLWLINHAETIMTDSYHGSIFSLLFHKNLWIFQRFTEDNPICQNSRIRQLQHNFNLGQRIVTAKSKIDDLNPIDYEYFESQLKLLRASSLDFLKQALK